MLNPNFKVLGIGKAYNSSSTWDHYWTTDFGGYVDSGAIPCPGGSTTPTPTTGPSISVTDVSTLEGNSSTGATKLMNFKVKIPTVAKVAVKVNFAATSGTATAGSDFTAVTGQATIATGTRVATVSVPVVKDKLREANETIVLTISSPVNGVIGDGSGMGTILNDD